MMEKYQITINDEKDGVLLSPTGEEIYNWGYQGYEWPSEDAIEALLDDAGIGSPQKSVFATLFIGPDIAVSDDE